MIASALHSFRLARMTKSQRETKEWIAAIARHMNLSASQLALSAGMAASTVTRFLNDRTEKVTITQASIEKLAQFSGFRPYQFPGRHKAGGDPDAVAFEAEARDYPPWVQGTFLHYGDSGISGWIMKGAALDALGILPGDVVVIDAHKRPKAGDVVLAEVRDALTGQSEFVLRFCMPPFILTHSMRLGPQRPEQVDDDRVSIIGVSAGLIRVPR